MRAQFDKSIMKGYGISNTLSSHPVTEHTLFFGASTTKAFTSAAISLLVDDDHNFPAIQWDTPVYSILSADFVLNDPWSTSQMTIIDILSHRSGLPSHDMVWLANITLQEAVQSMRHLPFTASPRTEWQYSNLMYSTAAHLIETVTNKSLQTFLAENIWLPMNMTETYLCLSDAEKASRDISQGYYIDLDGELSSTKQVFTETLRGAGNILSSVSDYAKWVSTLLNRRPPFSQMGYKTLFGGHSIVSANPIEPYQTPTLYGLGWMLQAYNGEMILSHEGAQFGYGASVILLPQRNYGLVLLGNNMKGVNAAANVLAYHLIDEKLGIPNENRFDWIARCAKNVQLDSCQQFELFSLFEPCFTNLYANYRGNAIINETRLSEETIEKLYPRIPNPPLANPLNISAYEGFYTHPSYPQLRVSSNCTGDPRVYQGLNRTTPDLCASLPNYNDYSRDLEIAFFHVSGTYWYEITAIWAIPSAARVEFLVNPDSSASWLGIEIEPSMAKRGEKIWWRRVL